MSKNSKNDEKQQLITEIFAVLENSNIANNKTNKETRNALKPSLESFSLEFLEKGKTFLSQEIYETASSLVNSKSNKNKENKLYQFPLLNNH